MHQKGRNSKEHLFSVFLVDRQCSKDVKIILSLQLACFPEFFDLAELLTKFFDGFSASLSQ